MLLALLIFAVTLQVEAQTPQGALLVAAEQADAGALRLSARALRGFPKAAPGLRFWARVISVEPERLSVELVAVREGRSIAQRVLHLQRAEPSSQPTSVVVPRRTIRRGQIMQASDLKMVPGPGGEGFARDFASLVGKAPKRALLRGRPIPNRLVQAAAVVQRGERVKVVIRTGALAISMTGEAIQSGAVGETISVLNKGSRRVLTARVVGAGLLEIP